MSGKNFHLTPLESRKQLLLVESELNRVQLLNELRDLKSEISHVTEQVRTIGSFASSVAKLTTTFSTIGNIFNHGSTDEEAKSSWFSKLLNGARTGASIWGALRSKQK
jgi:hypothetical protein